jgi:DNA gyrase subunit B
LRNVIEYNYLFDKMVLKGVHSEVLKIFVEGRIRNGFEDMVDLAPLVERLKQAAPHADFQLFSEPDRILFTMGNVRARIDRQVLEILSSHEYHLLLQAWHKVQESSCNDKSVISMEGKEESVVNDCQELLEFFQARARKGQYIQRYKGLGEMNPDQLWETTMDPEKRVLLQVKVEDAVEANEIFTVLMGDQVEPRREFIENNALNVSNLDI